MDGEPGGLQSMESQSQTRLNDEHVHFHFRKAQKCPWEFIQENQGTVGSGSLGTPTTPDGTPCKTRASIWASKPSRTSWAELGAPCLCHPSPTQPQYSTASAQESHDCNSRSIRLVP